MNHLDLATMLVFAGLTAAMHVLELVLRVERCRDGECSRCWRGVR